MYSEGFDDYSTAGCRLELGADGAAGRDRALRRRRGRPGVRDPRPADRPDRAARRPGRARVPPTPRSGRPVRPRASRQTWMSGGAVQLACRAVREALLARAAGARGRTGRRVPTRALRPARRRGGRPRHRRRRPGRGPARRRPDRGGPRAPPRRRPTRSTTTARATRTCRSPSPRTAPSSTSTPTSASSAWSQIATGQDVGKALNPRAVTGPDRGRHRPGRRPRGDGGDRRRRTAGSGTRRSPTTSSRPRWTCRRWSRRSIEQPEPGRPVRREGRRRAADDLLDAGRRGGDPRRDRAAAHARPGPPAGHRPAPRAPSDATSRVSRLVAAGGAVPGRRRHRGRPHRRRRRRPGRATATRSAASTATSSPPGWSTPTTTSTSG